MRLLSFILAGLLACTAIAAPGDQRQAQIDAAAADAVAHLTNDIESQPISPSLTVGQLSRRDLNGTLAQTLRRADQIGGPRWLDGDTCQVKLSITSERVRQALVEAARNMGSSSPIPAEALDAKLHDSWDGRTFAATGSSISAGRALELSAPAATGPWAGVTADARRKAIEQARDAAIGRARDSIKSIDAGDGKTVADLLANPQVNSALHDWLIQRPVTRVEFFNDLSVELTMWINARDLLSELRSAAGGGDDATWAKMRKEAEIQLASAVGRGRVDNPGATAGQPTLRITDQPPAWITASLSSEATEKFTGTKLKTARAAENSAMGKLREKVDALGFRSGTIGDAAHRSAAMEEAVNQAMSRSRTYKIDYLPDGGATVRVWLDPRDLWDELRELP